MCGYTCHMFGAPYPDAVCVDGFMWDLDSEEDGFMSSGGDIHCPLCETAKWLSDIADGAVDDIPLPKSKDTPAAYWEAAILYAFDINPSAARAYLYQIRPFELLDQKDRVEGPTRAWEEADHDEDPGIVWREWPWTVSKLSKHDQISIMPRDADT